jgi:hypothetical protein
MGMQHKVYDELNDSSQQIFGANCLYIEKQISLQDIQYSPYGVYPISFCRFCGSIID